MRLRSTLGGVVTAAVLVAGLTGCGSDASADERTSGAHEFDKVADQETCLADATPADKPWPEGFPADWPFPEETATYNVEDRGSDGTIVTAVSGSDFADVLSFMNHDVVDAGYRIESGETEDHDAEAEWDGNGFRGRWSIRESAQCPNETVIQVLSARE